MDAKKKAASLIRKYGTNNPFKIAAEKNILILFENLGSINGYYNKQLRQKQIHINQNLSRHMQRFTAAHELGHALIHPNENTPFLRNNTFLLVDKLEIEANHFAIELLIPDSEFREYISSSHTVDQIARIYGYDRELIKLKQI